MIFPQKPHSEQLAAAQLPDLLLENVGSAKNFMFFLKKKKKRVDKNRNGFYILQNVKAIPVVTCQIAASRQAGSKTAENLTERFEGPLSAPSRVFMDGSIVRSLPGPVARRRT